VLENRSNHESRLLALPVIRVLATGAAVVEPVFWLEGGPGMSNMQFKPFASLLANHDIVMVGYRGVDGSTVLECSDVSRAFGGAAGDLLSRASRASVGAAAAQCAGRLEAEGIELAGYTIPEVVKDLEAACAALGYARINLLSQSYGTRIAQIYATLHPDQLYRSAMIGVNPPGHFVWEPSTIDCQLRYYAQLCAQDVVCRTRTPDLAATVRRVAHAMPSRWLGIPIDPGKVKAVSFALLFNRGTATQIFDAYAATDQLLRYWCRRCFTLHLCADGLSCIAGVSSAREATAGSGGCAGRQCQFRGLVAVTATATPLRAMTADCTAEALTSAHSLFELR
jgi:pimeloyl-ACP methyl ester carboxylesterase